MLCLIRGFTDNEKRGIIIIAIERIKYPALVLTFALGNAFGLVAKLGLLNLPLGIAVAGIGFGAAVIGGIVHAPKTAFVKTRENAGPKKSLLKSAISDVRSFAGFYFDTFKTPEYVVGASAAHGGYNLLFQAVMGISLCATGAWMAPVLMPLAIGGCVALTGIALYSIIGGIDEQFRGIGEFYHNRFNKGAPIDPSQKNLIQKFVARQSVQKFIQQPVVQKFLNLGVVKSLRKAPSPKAKKILLTVMSVETSLFSLVAATTVLLNSPAIVPLVIAGFWGGSSAWGLVQAARNAGLFKYVAGRMTGKKGAVATASAPAVRPTHAPVTAPRSLFTKLTGSLTGIFKRYTGKNNAGRTISAGPLKPRRLQPAG